MSREQIMAKILAAAYLAAAELGHNEAIQMLEQALRDLKAAQWNDGRRP